MAEALTRDALDRKGVSSDHVRVLSAGVAAGIGSPATPEAIVALRGHGIESYEHTSQPATPDLISSADLIFALTPAHAEGLRRVAPGAAERVRTLDPSGQGVPDPIGGPQSLYDQTAAEIKRLIEAQLKDIIS